MTEETISIEIYDKAHQVSTTMAVIKLTENTFRATENELIDDELTVGTEFETLINEAGKHELVRIVKKSELTTHRFWLPKNVKRFDLEVLGDEIMRQGGFWQVDFGGIVTINLPKDSQIDVNEIKKLLDVK